MPPPTTMRTFLEAIRSGRTNTTEALDMLFASPAAVRAHPNFTDLQAPGMLNMLQPWARAELRRLGVGSEELAHIDDWPNNQKEIVRQKLVDAMNGNKPVEFSWKVYPGATEDTSIDEGPAKVTITFFSPESKVRATGPDSVSVDVGP